MRHFEWQVCDLWFQSKALIYQLDCCCISEGSLWAKRVRLVYGKLSRVFCCTCQMGPSSRIGWGNFIIRNDVNNKSPIFLYAARRGVQFLQFNALRISTWNIWTSSNIQRPPSSTRFVRANAGVHMPRLSSLSTAIGGFP